MDNTIQEGARGQDHSDGTDLVPVAGDPPDHPVAVEHQTLGRPGAHAQVRGLRQLGLHGLAVQAAIDLTARPLNRRAARAVQQAELDAGHIPQPTHDPVHGVDLADQMTLAQTADGRIARHLANGFQLLGQQQGVGPRARGHGRGLTAGVTAPDDNDVELQLHGAGHKGKGDRRPPEHRFT